MIKESIVELISAIADGNTLAIEDSFNSVMASKISDRLDSMRVDVAQGMFGSVDESYDIEDYSVEELEDFMMSEDFEQLDEISKKTLGSYVTKAHDQLMKHTASVNFKSGRGDSDVLSYTHEPRTARKTANRTKGVSKAVDKLTKESFDIEDYSVEELEDFMMSEDFEQLDEISKKTLGSYVVKAGHDQAQHAIKVFGVTPRDKEEHAERKVSFNKLLNRQNGIPKAVNKLTKD